MHHPTTFRALITLSAALILAAAACNTPAGTAPTATAPIVMDAVPAPTTTPELPTTAPNETVVLPPTPTLPATVDAGASITPTNAPPDAPPPNADYNGISFFFNHDISSGWEVEVVPADDQGGGAPENWLIPSHYRFTLTGYNPANSRHQPVILVFPIKNFEDYNPYGLEVINQMRALLDTKQPVDTLEGHGTVGGQPLPLLPIFNAAEVFRARVEYVQFQNGEGVRFLTQYDQAVNPINNHDMFYTFQGITYDDQYYVAVIMPIAHPDLLNEVTQADYDAVANRFEEHLTETVALLSEADAAVFTPDLSLLDQMVNSLTVAIAP